MAGIFGSWKFENFGFKKILELKSVLLHKYPQFIMGVLAQAKNGDKQFWN